MFWGVCYASAKCEGFRGWRSGATVNPFSAEATFVQSTRAQRLFKTCYVGIHSLIILSNKYPFAWVSIISQTFYIILFWPN